MTEVIVIGTGLAGLSAAIQAFRSGAQVTILEKTGAVGANSNSAKATSGINSAPSHHQIAQGISDSASQFNDDTIRLEWNCKYSVALSPSPELPFRLFLHYF